MCDTGEVAISEALLRVLCEVHAAEPCLLPTFSDEFETPVSDGSLRNFDGSKLITRVDFCFRLKVNPYPGRSKLYNGIFVEAKLITSGSFSLYASTGLIKFLNGDYAWAMSQGMMVAYVLPTDQVLQDALDAYFKRFGNARKYGVKAPPQQWPIDLHLPRPCTTIHERDWRYPAPHGNAPGDIEIIHLWLPLNATALRHKVQ